MVGSYVLTKTFRTNCTVKADFPTPPPLFQKNQISSLPLPISIMRSHSPPMITTLVSFILFSFLFARIEQATKKRQSLGFLLQITGQAFECRRRLLVVR